MSIDRLREKIDGVDARIVRLLNMRFRYALQTRKYKAGTRDPRRERSILRRVRSLSLPPAGPEVLARIYAKILAESRDLQEQKKEKTHENRHSRRGKNGGLAGPGAGGGERRRRPRRSAG